MGEKAMISRVAMGFVVSVLGVALVAPSATAQGRGGMRGSGGGAHVRGSFHVNGREGFPRPGQRRFLNDSAYLFPYFYPDYDEDYEGTEQAAGPVQIVYGRPAPVQVVAPAPVPAPGEPLLLELRDGQWMRVPTGNEMQTAPASAKLGSTPASNAHPGIVEIPDTAAPLPALPPAVIVFRDGHSEEVGKYMIQGVILYTSADVLTTGSYTRRIPLSELDIPASLKLNKERGTKFNLPTGPNEVVVRF